ncbi:MAG: hypothetical protein H6595_11280 [Flavobacteriales bacterium]|nr:hypothetical protein [Flavobacteriales bacterium]MCB9168042.1 hypothetical protein [Flavobacteriales bacterium]
MRFLASIAIGLLIIGAPARLLASGPHAPMPRGSLFLYWGYNRSGYGTSDIHFNGPGYDFTLHRVKAVDRAVAFEAKTYFSPATMWVPQYNYRLGWFITDRFSLSLGLDHMKYFLVTGQEARMTGSIDPTRSEQYAGDDIDQMVVLAPDLVQYEHSDGLNLLSVDLDRYDRIWSGTLGRIMVHAFEGVHVGPVIPRSDVRLFGEGVNNRFHLAGFGLGVQAGVHVTILRYVFLRVTGRAGWIDLPNVLTTGTSEDRAHQNFLFYQGSAELGAQFRF